ncbi:MAG: zinc-ribbon domain containing protein [Dehalococcoidales bacterium]|nr:zinc-ribbon domain containing protein [Dehalococcoidales bacterium]
MTYSEKSITCSDCGKTFPFTVEEQEFFASKGYTNEPRRCPACRSNRRAERMGNDGGMSRGPRQMYPATCAQCGKQTEIPFQPRGDRPVYCRECFTKSR